MSGNIPSAPPPSPKPPAPAPIQTSTAKPKWGERWLTVIDAAGTGIVMAFWAAGVTAHDEPRIAYLLFSAGAFIGTISIFAEPTRPLRQKIKWTTLLIFFFAFSSGFIAYHQIQGLAVSQGELMPDGHAQSPSSASPVNQVGNNSTVIGTVPTGGVGNNSTIVNETDSNGNTILTSPMAVGAGACAGPGSIAIGAGAGANGCLPQSPLTPPAKTSP